VIPPRNVLWILAYATDELYPGGRAFVSADDTDAPLDALAAAFVTAVERLVKRGIARGYTRHVRELASVRGTIDLLQTRRRDSLARGRVCCRFDDLTSDTVTNRILRTALQLIQTSTLSRTTRQRAQSLERWFMNVGLLARREPLNSPTSAGTSRSQYDVPLALAGCLIAATVPSGAGVDARFIEAELASPDSRLFERFVRNFLRRHLTDCNVTRYRRPWSDARPCTAAAETLLPTTETDVVLEYIGRKVVIDTKFYRETLREHRGSRRVREAHLYQLIAYLHNERLQSPPNERIEGVLLYPEMETELDVAWIIHGFPLRVRTIDLSASWRTIHEALLAIGREGGMASLVNGHDVSPAP
jgi:5-methylcytosine-specific restriction enzyme subunit McrC